MPKILPYLVITFINMAGFAVVFPVMPEMLHHFETTAPDSGHYLSALAAKFLPPAAATEMRLVFLGGILSLAYSLTAYFAAPLWGRLSDRYGRRPIIFISTAGLMVSSSFWIFYPGIGILFISRLLAGCFSGSLGVVGAAIADTSTEEEKATRMGYFGAALGAGMLLGPVIGGLLSLIELPLWHRYSHLAIATCVLYGLELLLNRFWMQETLRVKNTQPGRLQFFPAIGSVRGRDFRILWVVYVLYCAVFSAIDFVMPYFYRLEFSLAPHGIALVFLLIGVVLVLGQALLSAKAIRRFGYKSVLVTMLAIMPVPLVLMGFTPPCFALSLLGVIPIALCGSFFMPVVPGLGTALAPSDQKGYYMGVLDAGRALAFAVGPIAGAALYFWLGSRAGLMVMAALIFAAAIGSMFLQGDGLQKR